MKFVGLVMTVVGMSRLNINPKQTQCKTCLFRCPTSKDANRGGDPKWNGRTGVSANDLHSADLHSADLHSADLHSADLHSADECELVAPLLMLRSLSRQFRCEVDR